MQYRIISDNPNFPVILMRSDGDFHYFDSVEEAEEVLKNLRTDCDDNEHRQRPERGCIEQY